MKKNKSFFICFLCALTLLTEAWGSNIVTTTKVIKVTEVVSIYPVKLEPADSVNIFFQNLSATPNIEMNGGKTNSDGIAKMTLIGKPDAIFSFKAKKEGYRDTGSKTCYISNTETLKFHIEKNKDAWSIEIKEDIENGDSEIAREKLKNIKALFPQRWEQEDFSKFREFEQELKLQDFNREGSMNERHFREQLENGTPTPDHNLLKEKLNSKGKLDSVLKDKNEQ